MTMADILPNDAAEQDDTQFDRHDPIALCDNLADDQLAVRGIYLAVSGLQDLGVDRRDLEAISMMIRQLEDRLEKRREQAEVLQESIAAHLDAEALRKPGKGYWHRDAHLVQAWDEWRAALRASLEAPADVAEAEEQRLDAACDEADSRIEQLHARTPLGLAVKLRYLFHEWAAERDAQHALAHNEPITDDMLPDARSKLLWEVVRIAERLARPAAAAGRA